LSRRGANAGGRSRNHSLHLAAGGGLLPHGAGDAGARALWPIRIDRPARGDADRGATAAVPRSGAPFPARSELRVQRLGDAGVGLGKPARAALPLHAVRRRRVLAGRAAMDLELLRGHWRYGTGAAWRVAV